MFQKDRKGKIAKPKDKKKEDKKDVKKTPKTPAKPTPTPAPKQITSRKRATPPSTPKIIPSKDKKSSPKPSKAPKMTPKTTTPSKPRTTGTPIKSRKRMTTMPKVSSKTLPGVSKVSKGTEDKLSVGATLSPTISAIGVSKDDGLGRAGKLDEGFIADKLGDSSEHLPTIPKVILTNDAGEFSFSIDSDQDIKFYIEVYQKTTPIGGSKIPSKQQTPTIPQNFDLNLLFSTRDCYEGTWTEKKVSLDKKKKAKELTEFLEKKGLVLDWQAGDTPSAELALEPRVSLQTPEDLDKDASFSKMKSKLKMNLPDPLQNPVLVPKTEVIATQPIDVNKDIIPNFGVTSLTTVLKQKVSNVIVLNTFKELSETFDPIMAAPKIDESMYEPLRKISLDYILPGAGNIQNNTVILLEENRRFIESYLAGLNHEMNRELVWREFPTDQRGTVFQYFWDPVLLEEDEDGNLIPPTDINEIHRWTEELGKNSPSEEREQSSNIVLVIKGDVIRRYPDLIIYALVSPLITEPSQFNSSIKEIIQPIFRSQLAPDMLAMGFPISNEEIENGLEGGDLYYFVLQEQQDLPVFGFDVSSTPTGGSSSDISWDQIDSKLRNNYIDDFNEILGGNPNAANITAKTMQIPVRIVINAKTLILGSQNT